MSREVDMIGIDGVVHTYPEWFFLLLKGTNVIALCSTCHDFTHHSSHPIGEKAIDQRNKNLTVDCLSCHKSHGSDQKRLAHFQFGMDLCVQCHEQLKR